MWHSPLGYRLSLLCAQRRLLTGTETALRLPLADDAYRLFHGPDDGDVDAFPGRALVPSDLRGFERSALSLHFEPAEAR
jgi:hypothetical protein